MDIQELWERALENTKVIRPRIQDLKTFSVTHLPYVMLSDSSTNLGNTVVRKGELQVEKPSLVLPEYSPQFQGFDFEKDLSLNPNFLTNFLLIRGVKFPSLKYNNKSCLDVYNGDLEKAVLYYYDLLQRQEDVYTGLISGPEDCWQFSLLIFISNQVVRSADSDISKILDEFKKKKRKN